jgi:hypothetical protein
MATYTFTSLVWLHTIHVELNCDCCVLADALFEGLGHIIVVLVILYSQSIAFPVPRESHIIEENWNHKKKYIRDSSPVYLERRTMVGTWTEVLMLPMGLKTFGNERASGLVQKVKVS